MALRSSILITSIISVVIGAGIAYVGIPAVDPTYNTESMTATQTISQTVTQTVSTPQTGVIQEKVKSWQDESYISDSQLSWQLMNQTQYNFTTSGNSYIVVQFSAPYLVYLDPTFTGAARWEVSLVISGQGNTTVRIEFSDAGPATGSWRELTYSPTLSMMTGKLPAGTYTCSVYWRSIFDSAGLNQLIVSSHNQASTYHYDRWMIVQEIAG